MAKNKEPNGKNPRQNPKTIKKKISQSDPKNPPPDPVQLYQIEELGNGIAKINETLGKIKTELKIDSFTNLANYLENLLDKIITEKDIAKKTNFHGRDN